MQITLLESTGARVEAILLSARRDRIRLAIPGQEDVVEVHPNGSRWTTEDGRSFELEAVLALYGPELSVETDGEEMFEHIANIRGAQVTATSSRPA